MFLSELVFCIFLLRVSYASGFFSSWGNCNCAPCMTVSRSVAVRVEMVHTVDAGLVTVRAQRQWSVGACDRIERVVDKGRVSPERHRTGRPTCPNFLFVIGISVLPPCVD